MSIPPLDPPAVTVRDLEVELFGGRRSGDRPYGALLHPVQGLSFTAPAGQVTALVGTNGAGKTTTLRALSGAIPFTGGSIDVLGTALGPAAVGLPRGAALVPESLDAPRRWTPRHLSRAYATTVAGAFDPDAFERRLGEHGVPLDRAVGTFSRGQVTQLALSAALARDPRLLLLDEPLARLDPLARTDLVDELRDLLAREERTILLSTHDLEGMDRFVDHLVVIAQGFTVLEGDVETLREEFLLLERAVEETGADVPALGSPLLGAVTAGGTQRALVHVEEAADLPPGTDLRRPGVSDLVTHWLRATTAETRRTAERSAR